MSAMAWVRRSFLTGFLVMVPLVVSIVAFVWIFGVIDGLTAPLYERLLGRRIPGLGIATTALGVMLVGVFATNVIGKRVLQTGEQYLLMIPVFKNVYSPVKQLVAAFSPDNEFGFKRVALVETKTGFSIGFLTKEFTVDRGRGPEALVAVYVPTNHLYLGDVVVCRREDAIFPDITVEQGIRVLLTGGMAMPDRLAHTPDNRGLRDFRV